MLPWWAAKIYVASQTRSGFCCSSGEGAVAAINGTTVASKSIGQTIGELSAMLRLLRLIRMLRIFRFSAYSSSIKIFMLTISRSLSSMGILLMAFLIVLMLFSSVLYFAEERVKGPSRHDYARCPGCFDSILNTMWHCVNTLTSAGYGDSTPATALGKAIMGIGGFTGSQRERGVVSPVFSLIFARLPRSPPHLPNPSPPHHTRPRRSVDTPSLSPLLRLLALSPTPLSHPSLLLGTRAGRPGDADRSLRGQHHQAVGG